MFAWVRRSHFLTVGLLLAMGGLTGCIPVPTAVRETAVAPRLITPEFYAIAHWEKLRPTSFPGSFAADLYVRMPQSDPSMTPDRWPYRRFELGFSAAPDTAPSAVWQVDHYRLVYPAEIMWDLLSVLTPEGRPMYLKLDRENGIVDISSDIDFRAPHHWPKLKLKP